MNVIKSCGTYTLELLTNRKCAFCRQPGHKNFIKANKKLMKKNNPRAFMMMADAYKLGSEGVLQSDTRALEMLIKAAELGHVSAYVKIGYCYDDEMVGELCISGIVEEDISKALEFYRVAAKKGSILAHRYLADFYRSNWNSYESIKHLKVVASAGDRESMDDLMRHYKNKLLSKEELTQTLRAFQTSNNELKNKDRDDARAFMVLLKSKDRDDIRAFMERLKAEG